MVRAEIYGRLESAAGNSVFRAFAISLIFHFLLFGSIEVAYRLGWVRQSPLTSLLLTSRMRSDPRSVSEANREQPPEVPQVPVVFVEVDPAQAVEEAPKETKYYSTHNSVAANRESEIDSKTPKISGVQDKVAKITEAPRAVAVPVEPAPLVEKIISPQRAKIEPEVLQAKPLLTPSPSLAKPGDTAMLKPSDLPTASPPVKRNPAAENPNPPRLRPRTIAAALQQQGVLAGDKMKQEGGVRRFSFDGLDVKATPFASYDQMIIAAIQKRWYDLLEDRDFARSQVGRVVLTFRLNVDGRVTEMRVEENEVSEILALVCQRAVQDPAPYPPWPSDLRRMVGADYREVKFTFHHN